jgi:LPS sulfotransferase NodH
MVDIDALVTRDYDGNIEAGILRSFHPLVDDHEAWTAWFRESGITSLDELKTDGDGGHGDGPG